MQAQNSQKDPLKSQIRNESCIQYRKQQFMQRNTPKIKFTEMIYVQRKPNAINNRSSVYNNLVWSASTKYITNTLAHHL